MKSIVLKMTAAVALWATAVQVAMAQGAGGGNDVGAIPEPGTLALAGVAVAAALYSLRRKK